MYQAVEGSVLGLGHHTLTDSEFADDPVVQERAVDHFEVGRRRFDNRAEGTAGQFLLIGPGPIAAGGR
jgi:hypothetical protein